MIFNGSMDRAGLECLNGMVGQVGLQYLNGMVVKGWITMYKWDGGVGLMIFNG